MAVATTFTLPNFVGELFSLTPKVTPLLSMIGGLTGGQAVTAKEFTFQDYSMATAAQPAILEAAAPVSAQRVRAEKKNVVQIFQYGVDISYTKLAATGTLGTGGSTPAIAATSIIGTQPVQNELDWQVQLKLEQAALDVNYTFHNGVFVNPVDNTTARGTRGMLPWITTNVVAAGGAALSDALVDQLVALMFANGAPFREPVLFVSAVQKMAISGIYGYAPESRTVGGLNIQRIITDLAEFGIVIDRHIPAGVVALYDMSVIAPRFLEIPGKGHFFLEPMAKTKASEEVQLYGEIGLAQGPETWHGKITGLA